MEENSYKVDIKVLKVGRRFKVLEKVDLVLVSIIKIEEKKKE